MLIRFNILMADLLITVLTGVDFDFHCPPLEQPLGGVIIISEASATYKCNHSDSAVSETLWCSSNSGKWEGDLKTCNNSTGIHSEFCDFSTSASLYI